MTPEIPDAFRSLDPQKIKQIDGERKEKPVPKQEAAEDDAAKKAEVYQKGQKGLENVSFDELLEITRQWDADRSFSFTRR